MKLFNTSSPKLVKFAKSLRLETMENASVDPLDLTIGLWMGNRCPPNVDLEINSTNLLLMNWVLLSVVMMFMTHNGLWSLE